MVRTRGAAVDDDPPGPGRPRGRPRGAVRGAALAPVQDLDPEGDEPQEIPAPPPPEEPLPAAQPPALPGMTPAVQAALAQFLNAIGAIPQAPSTATGAPVPQVQPAPPVPEVQPPLQPVAPEGSCHFRTKRCWVYF